MEAKLIWKSKEKNENGFPIEKNHETEIYVTEKSVARNEFYESMRSGIEVKKVLETRQEDFEGSLHLVNGKKAYATNIIFDDEEYEIIRTYKTGKAKIEIICR